MTIPRTRFACELVNPTCSSLPRSNLGQAFFFRRKNNCSWRTFLTEDSWKYAPREGDARALTRTDEFFGHAATFLRCSTTGLSPRNRQVMRHLRFRVSCWQKGTRHHLYDVVADPLCRHDRYARSGMRSTNSIGTPTNRSRPSRLPKVDS